MPRYLIGSHFKCCISQKAADPLNSQISIFWAISGLVIVKDQPGLNCDLNYGSKQNKFDTQMFRSSERSQFPFTGSQLTKTSGSDQTRSDSLELFLTKHTYTSTLIKAWKREEIKFGDLQSLGGTAMELFYLLWLTKYLTTQWKRPPWPPELKASRTRLVAMGIQYWVLWTQYEGACWNLAGGLLRHAT